MKTLQQIIEGLNIKYEARQVARRPDGVTWGATFYRIRIRCGSHRMTTYWSQGGALTEAPSLADVLDCLASDAASLENAKDFAEFATESGYNNGTEAGLREAQRVYKAVCRTSAQLKRVLGESVYNALLWDCERL